MNYTLIYNKLKNQEVVFHSFLGLLLGYFILHPLSMVIYWFENNSVDLSWEILKEIFSESIVHSFSLHMMPMSVSFAVLGALAGIGSGLYYRSIKRKNRMLFGKKQLLQQSIPTLIENRENELVEFKSSLRYDYRQVKTDKNLEQIILKSIAGFLNANGGTLIIGVDDYGEILGLENDYWTLSKKNSDGFQLRLMLLIANAFGKHMCTLVHITFHEIENKEICTLYVESSNSPVYLNEGNRTIFYLRTGNATNPLTTSETVKYLQNRKQF